MDRPIIMCDCGQRAEFGGVGLCKYCYDKEVNAKDDVNEYAFACASENGHQAGMTLRDYFAAKAMHGIMTSEALLQGTHDAHEGEIVASAISNDAYDIADAMIKARGKV